MDLSTATSLFPFLEGSLADAVGRQGMERRYRRGTVLYDSGGPCPFVPFLLAGVIRVYKLGESGREVTLYRVLPGETCIMSTSCTLTEQRYPAMAEAEEDVHLLALPGHVFRQLMERFPKLQAFVLQGLADRLAEVMAVVEELVFRRVDLRLVERLLQRTAPPAKPVVELTHAQLAVELGSVREVISRILKDLERNGLVRLGRGRVEVVARERLQAHRRFLAEGNGGPA
ncbi:MAG: Crp/Fnr family transcriptional regulator [Candidatus Lambdaproteobacteria bacterium]|nr:Crp/Fnr family transcriptional regulator [Candidatus Lambdaproteobacteria bacterium]